MSDDIERKLLAAYGAAMRATHQGGRISIRISPDVAEWAREKWSTNPDDPAWMPPTVKTCWGFPLIIEESWEPGRVVVSVDTEIR